MKNLQLKQYYNYALLASQFQLEVEKFDLRLDLLGQTIILTYILKQFARDLQPQDLKLPLQLFEIPLA